MRFICDLCPSTSLEGHAAVIIGNYEQWIRHLLTPQHQTEQNLVMTRTSYWPQAEWIAMIKDLPAFGEDTAELFVDLMLNLSEYGFIEALYYGSRTKDSLCAALQLYETNVCPSYLMYRDGKKYDLKVAPKFPMNGKIGGKMGRRRQRYGSIASTLSEDSGITSVDVATSTMEDHEKDVGVVDSIANKVAAEVIIDQGEPENKCSHEKKPRIKYSRDTLLEFYGEKNVPLRLHDVLILHDIILKEPKFIDLEQFRQPKVQWCLDTSRNFPSTRTNNSFRPPTLRHNQIGHREIREASDYGNGRGQYQRNPHPRNQNGWNAQRPERLQNNNSRWAKDQENIEVKPIEEEEEEWW